MVTELDLSCDICFEPYYSTSVGSEDRRPTVVCTNGHTCCFRCAGRISTCFSCRRPCLDTPIVNVALIGIVDSKARLYLLRYNGWL